MQLPVSGRIVVQAIAPHFMSVETSVNGKGDMNLSLDRHYDSCPQEAKRWIAAHAIPLTTVEAGHGFDDMQPLRKLVGSARIVSAKPRTARASFSSSSTACSNFSSRRWASTSSRSKRASPTRSPSTITS
ncbi:MAG TPA: hypothetical protein VII75_06375 [Thermoanaerobaculia bacterium]|nr:hypothetical protein [Thermoanaerobaculia bacterium]